MKDQSMQTIWKSYKVQNDELNSWKIGDLKLWCNCTTNEIQIAYKHFASDEPENQSEAPEDITWSRWAIKNKHPQVQLSPIFPDRSVVVKPESSFRIKINAQARIYVRIPIWLKIDLIDNKPVHLIDLPTVIISNTWFGTFFEGELCYWISSGVRQQVEPDSTRSYSAVCPIQLINKSEEDLLVEKICLRVHNLSLFFDNMQLWSDEIKILYKGSNDISQIKATGAPPQESPSAVLLTSPRKLVKKSIAAKTFASLKDLPGLGIPNH